MVAARGVVQAQAVSDDERRIDFSTFDTFHQRLLVFVRIRLPRLQRESFVEDRADGELAAFTYWYNGDFKNSFHRSRL